MFHKQPGLSQAQKPAWREWLESLIVVAVIAILVRSFVVAPFKIPSSSMVPTLEVGDYIFVLRYPYGLRIPFTDMQFFAHPPKRGDVAVFDYPEDRSKDYIKRIIGLPGDTIEYTDNKLSINGVEMPLELDGRRTYFLADGEADVSGLFTEQLGDVKHQVLRKPQSIRDGVWKIPQGMFFVLGDNRNNSRDSRFWGYVPQSYLVGHAAIVWWSWDGHAKKVRWDRLGHLVE
ncbi:MAG: signal peptidase I [Zetaproteobacteria bacterium CG06_land_8_20_14_3_00_59_53]|nr:MAG: signal peptidase I [Zetaproteobacteria bacterium CG2_30_59_37]PIO90807.1 MAG: signal peptidase I [Zetaproteobacteria bacterium CG23_combo_of_CG06-09_8_20_14_all_59_86]PIQ64717.1 MAG: signal peptidase I [Zetaproteobacteria bacterium CG11_big_fil_rev_8_21_14_0_20_59_439]PIU71117.1 MAG: signal peptidase I [Zetaproteobacteria bacterium CG06_land_8_20_14_3_00_59_53]PIU96611.1 MAG: signal peptidase I [Zetaproteobacteria bacterium CG03_land_8_20_14_0_80_59_51]PIY46214.1 MAG: signal peptidase 